MLFEYPLELFAACGFALHTEKLQILFLTQECNSLLKMYSQQ